MTTEKDNIICSVNASDAIKVSQTLEHIPDLEQTKTMAALFKAFADPTRLQILEALAFDEHCVCDLAAVLNLSMSAISHQLRQLRDNGLVDYRKEGKMVHYTLRDPHIVQLLALGHNYTAESI